MNNFIHTQKTMMEATALLDDLHATFESPAFIQVLSGNSCFSFGDAEGDLDGFGYDITTDDPETFIDDQGKLFPLYGNAGRTRSVDPQRGRSMGIPR